MMNKSYFYILLCLGIMNGLQAAVEDVVQAILNKRPTSEIQRLLETIPAGHINDTVSLEYGPKTFEGNALMAAALTGNTDVIDILLKQGADINAQDTQGRRPLFYAGTLDVVKRLLAANPDLEARDAAGMPVLMTLMHTPFDGLVVLKDDDLASAIELLHEKGAQVNVQDYLGHTPIMFAVDIATNPDLPKDRNYSALGLALVKKLIALGADPYIKNNKGGDAFDYTRGKQDIIKALPTKRSIFGNLNNAIKNNDIGSFLNILHQYPWVDVRTTIDNVPWRVGEKTYTIPADLLFKVIVREKLDDRKKFIDALLARGANIMKQYKDFYLFDFATYNPKLFVYILDKSMQVIEQEKDPKKREEKYNIDDPKKFFDYVLASVLEKSLVHKGLPLVIRGLLKRTTDPNYYIEGKTPLIEIMQRYNEFSTQAFFPIFKDIVQVLIDKGADPEKSSFGKTAFEWADEIITNAEHRKVIKSILEKAPKPLPELLNRLIDTLGALKKELIH